VKIFETSLNNQYREAYMNHRLSDKLLISFSTICFVAAAVSAQQLTGYDVMKKADDVDKGTTGSYTASMTLLSKNGNTRTREVVCLSKDFGSVTKSVIVFRTPKDVAGVGYLTWDYDEKNGVKKDSDDWLYMPAMKKVRRISGSDSSGSFMGTDFTYDDMGDRGLTKDTFTLLGEEQTGETGCYKVECRAKDPAEKNPRRILWIRKDNYLLQKGEFYDRQNNLQRELTCSGITLIDGIWTTGTMTMKNAITGHATVIEMKDVHYNQKIDDSIFTVASIERGAVK
jgi:hypothetical protein